MKLPKYIKRNKDSNIRLTINFWLLEFASPSTGAVLIYWPLVFALQCLRQDLKKPIRIISGYRTAWDNITARGSSKSQHLIGKGVDIYVKGVSTRKIVVHAQGLGFRGIITSEGRTTVHLDLRSGKKYFDVPEGWL